MTRKVDCLTLHTFFAIHCSSLEWKWKDQKWTIDSNRSNKHEQKMIRSKIGDIRDVRKGEMLVHCVNCQGSMGAGLAKSIKNKWPEVYQDYVSHVNKSKKVNLLGTVRYFITDGPIVANLFGQLNYGTGARFVSYDALDAGFEAIAEEFRQMPEKIVVNFPLIGCGLAGGYWPVVKEIIEARLPDEGFDKVLWKLE